MRQARGEVLPLDRALLARLRLLLAQNDDPEAYVRFWESNTHTLRLAQCAVHVCTRGDRVVYQAGQETVQALQEGMSAVFGHVIRLQLQYIIWAKRSDSLRITRFYRNGRMVVGTYDLPDHSNWRVFCSKRWFKNEKTRRARAMAARPADFE